MSHPSSFRTDQQPTSQSGTTDQRTPAVSGSSVVPAAPYPPFLVPPFSAGSSIGSGGKSVLRSSLSSSPHYSLSHVATSSSESPSSATVRQQLQQSSHGSTRLASPDSAKQPTTSTTAAGDTNQSSRSRSRSFGEQTERKSPRAVLGVGSGGSRLICPSRVQFCPSRADIYACINCLAPPQEEVESAVEHMQDQVSGSGAATSGRAKKLGPILLELRRLGLVTDLDLRKQGQLFYSSTVAISRGNPQLGPSVASTCLSCHPSVVTTWDGGRPTLNSTADDNTAIICATGLTTGALCVHNFQRNKDGELSSSLDYFTPRHQRLASSVAWRPSNTQHVAIGLVSGAGLSMRRGGAASRAGGGDREFCCLVWDIETQAHSSVKGAAHAPVSKLSHSAGVASLAWLQEGRSLAVGCQVRTVQIYDLRVSGSNSPPISAWAHTEGVNGIEVDPHRPNVFATFSRCVGEPVKLWDARRMDSSLGEIKTSGLSQQQETTDSQENVAGFPGQSSLFGTGISGPVVSTIRWSSLYPGTLCVAMGSQIRNYDTSTGSRPVLTHENHTAGQIADMDLYRPMKATLLHPTGDENTDAFDGGEMSRKEGVTDDRTLDSPALERHIGEIAELRSHRMLVVLSDGTVRDTPKFPTAPLAVSRRDGRVVHALGKTVWIGTTAVGPSAMESLQSRCDEDISATMMRRARCLHAIRYSMDTAANIQMLSEERPLGNREELLRLWGWIERVESLSEERIGTDETSPWPAKGLIEAGVWRLLRMDVSDGNEYPHLDNATYSDSLSCNTYDSPPRRAALTSCGWAGRFSLSEVLAGCESFGEFERSAALAVWHGDIGAAVEALQRGADAIRSHSNSDISPRYAETLMLVSMCIAGYSGMDPNSSSSAVWRRACHDLLRRDELTVKSMSGGVAYLRAACTFLTSIGLDGGLDKVLYDEQLSLCDRVAFGCRFLERMDLRAYLVKCIERCQKSGNLEGMVATGLEKQGIGILQSYVDRSADVQTATLVCSRVILPGDWVAERSICSEWLDSYRELLNTWQMWQSRAMFDVDRAELLRRLKGRQADDMQGSSVRGGYYQGRIRSGKKQVSPGPPTKQQQNGSVLSVPAQLDARCNYCSMSLSGARRQEGVANQWLNKLKPVLSCCPRCRKPLPRCSICLLSLGCLNPYMELKRAGSRPSRSGAVLQPGDDLSSLANLPFAEWFTWCMRCKHGGHAHHLVGWFARNDICAVSGCGCRCQFDGIQKLNRPALAQPTESDIRASSAV